MFYRPSRKKTFRNVPILILILAVVLFLRKYVINRHKYKVQNIMKVTYNKFTTHDEIVELFYKNRMSIKTSELGSIMFKNSSVMKYYKIPKQVKGQKFLILVWKFWDRLKFRYVYYYGKRLRFPLEKCSVKNCEFTRNDSDITKVDAVVVHLQRGELPSNEGRNRHQRWIFLTDESPRHTQSLANKTIKLVDLKDVFNWSMTYRMDADIPVPYGRTVPLKRPIKENPTYSDLAKLVPYWNEKRWDIYTNVLLSNCDIRRMTFLNEMKRLLEVDIYGHCSDRKEFVRSCPGHFRSDCKLISHYLFYFVLENSKCLEYISEKVFSNAYSKGAIPIIVGPKLEDCYKLLPPDSFLHVANFESYESLSKEILSISKNKSRILQFHRWRNDFKIVNEHGYLGYPSRHLCRICEALNYNNKKEKIYNLNNIRKFLDYKLLCNVK